MTPPTSESFLYRAKPGKMLLAGGFFAACAILFAYKAATNDRGLIINGIFELGPDGADTFYVVLCVLSALFVLAAVAGTIHGFIKKPVLILEKDHVIIPSGVFLKHRMKRIDFRDIHSASLQNISGQEILTLQTRDEKASIARSLLHPDSAFDRIVDTVQAHMQSQAHDGRR